MRELDGQLEHRIALVTGGSRGVGAGVARDLARQGALVALSYNRDVESANRVVEDIERSGGRALAVQASAASPESWNDAVDEIERSYGPIDLLVSNAGTASKGKTVFGTDPAEFVDLMWVHALGPLALIQRLLPGMRAAGKSDIIMISSALVDSTPERSAPYSMAKSAMESACKTLAREERRNGIHVNIVAPGLVDTEMGARLVGAVDPGSSMTDTEARSPFGRVCKPADIAAAVSYLAGVGGGYITGQRIVIDGGGASPSLF